MVLMPVTGLVPGGRRLAGRLSWHESVAGPGEYGMNRRNAIGGPPAAANLIILNHYGVSGNFFARHAVPGQFIGGVREACREKKRSSRSAGVDRGVMSEVGRAIRVVLAD